MLDLIWIILIGGRGRGPREVRHAPGSDPGGFFVTALLGMGGALVATFLGRFVGLYGPGQGAGFLASVIGAIVVLIIYRSVRKRQG